jgi:hypothetical protein
MGCLVGEEDAGLGERVRFGVGGGEEGDGGG